ncbi:late competence protein ComER [Aliibacillus thermotolerans]|uniref:Late competence protein ComER n=1 Tax=Aliibacillus thermotolerans TaxID=1834418 RepID=A0ABW0U9E9_9BACI|nr:late competence protein ComER [Aliibacillus thermotolerans]MDA3130767.1 late competence protein ComER [Aliibacillus thermotolerans]
MEKVGILGTGNMGGMLLETMIEHGKINETNLYVYNRTPSRNEAIRERFPQVHLASDIPSFLKQVDTVFICVRPGQYKDIIDDLHWSLTEHHIVATITSPVRLEDLEELPARRIVRTVPSIVNRTGKGPMLLTFGHRWTEEEKQSFTIWLDQFAEPIPIDDTILRVSSDIVSCGPAFISFLLQKLIEAAAKETDISSETATKLTETMMISYGELLRQEYYTLRSLTEKVNVPGGITGEGLQVLDKYTEEMFEEVFRETHKKFAADQKEMKRLLC